MKYKFGIIGTGTISHTHAKAIKSINQAELIGCYDTIQKKSDEFAKLYGCKSFSSIEELLKKDIDVIDVCTPSGLHMEVALKAIAAGKNLLVEKPMEINKEKCQLIVQAAKKANVSMATIYPCRFYRATKLIRKALDHNRFGEISLISASLRAFRSKAYYENSGWRGTWKLDGGGALMNQSIHMVDLLYLFGGDISEVYAHAGIRGHEHIEVEDSAVATILYASGAMGVIEATTSSYPGTGKTIQISGMKGSVELCDEEITKWSFEDKEEGDQEIIDEYLNKKTTFSPVGYEPNIVGHREQIINFITSLDKKINPDVSFEEGIYSVNVINSIYESARLHKPIEIRRESK